MSRAPRWPNEAPRRSVDSDEELYPTFDETLTSGLEDTVRHFKAQPQWEHRGAADRPGPDKEVIHWLEKAVDEAKEEIKRLRKDMGNLVRAHDKKASIMSQGKFEKEMKQHITERIDQIRNIAIWAIGILFAVMLGIAKVTH